HDHLFIIERIKQLIKVKNHQVAPAELEALLLSHELVSDAVVVPVPNDMAGEVPKVFVVKDKGAVTQESSDTNLAEALKKYIQERTARYKWLGDGVEFINSVPK
ncbi:acetyl-CoA synthetase-like protein, partial [Zopfia rhizophila CBS 207.26]